MKQFSNISLSDYHTFHSSEKTSLLSVFESEKDAVDYLKIPGKHKRQIIGEGSNLLFSKDFDGEILKIENKGIEIVQEKGNWAWVQVAAGEKWDDLVDWAVKHGYGGLENLSYIPGTVGAAPVQNIGAYGVEFKDVFNSLRALHLESNEIQNFYLQELDFDYRYSVFKGPLKDQYLILNVVLKLSRYPQIKIDYGQLAQEVNRISDKSHPGIQEVRQAVINIRKSKLPETDELGNAGSFFKNPVVEQSKFQELQTQFKPIPHYVLEDSKIKIPAAWLIESCQLKGYSMGDAAVYQKHALIIVNKGKASGKELKTISEYVQTKVFEKFGISLEPEVLIL